MTTTLKHLTKLVSFDTQNPPRSLHCDSDIFLYLRLHLPGFNCQWLDSGEGCISLLATRGKPKLLFNFHIDTVAMDPDWEGNPFELEIEQDKATGLGASDSKGAIACMLTAVNKTAGDVALLFTSDKEHGSSKVVKRFLATDHGFDQVIVAEPTLAKAVLGHRGIQSATVHFSGIAGHASAHRAVQDSAVHRAARWMNAALNWAEQQTHCFDTLKGLPFNIGKIKGGIKGNMIAASCKLTFSFRPMPGQDSQWMLQQLADPTLCHLTEQDYEIKAGFTGPTLPAANQDFAGAIDKAQSLVAGCDLECGNAVNFWTEAALFSEAGLTAIVFGPGSIAQAHMANEWVAVSQLELVEAHYSHIIGSD